MVFLMICCYSIVKSQDHFSDVTDESGIDHFFIPYQGTFGGGVAVLDYDNDGHEDLFVAGGAGSNALYKNNGDGTFTNIIDEAGFEDLDTLVSQGITTADVNKDGYVDIFITAISSKNGGAKMEAPDLLYINNGDGTFSNETISYGLDKMKKFSTGATFGDINRDGYPDLFVGVFFENFSGRLDRYTGFRYNWHIISKGSKWLFKTSKKREPKTSTMVEQPRKLFVLYQRGCIEKLR